MSNSILCVYNVFTVLLLYLYFAVLVLYFNLYLSLVLHSCRLFYDKLININVLFSTLHLIRDVLVILLSRLLLLSTIVVFLYGIYVARNVIFLIYWFIDFAIVVVFLSNPVTFRCYYL